MGYRKAALINSDMKSKKYALQKQLWTADVAFKQIYKTFYSTYV